MEILTPELNFRDEQVTVSGSAINIEANLDIGIRFPLVAITNRIEAIWQGGTSGTPAVDGRYRLEIHGGTGVTSAAADAAGQDNNTSLLFRSDWQSLAQGTPANWGVLWVNDHRDWYGLPDRSRPIVVDGWSLILDNVDGAAETVRVRTMVAYQLARVSADEFAALRAAVP